VKCGLGPTAVERDPHSRRRFKIIPSEGTLTITEIKPGSAEETNAMREGERLRRAWQCFERWQRLNRVNVYQIIPTTDS